MSSNGWLEVPLGEILTRNENLISLAPDKQYREVTIRLWGKGVVLRQIVAGAEIAADRRIQVAPGQFIVSRIDARNGAMGIVPDELDGAVVTNDFPSFNINDGRLIPAFLGWLCKTPGFVDKCRAASEGTTNRVRLKEVRFMQQAIPLPPLEDQRRIVARIDRLAAKIDEAISIRRTAKVEADQLFGSYCHDLFSRRLRHKVPTIPLGEISDIRSGVTLGREINGDTLELPYLRVANVQDGYLDLSSIKRVSIRTDERDKWALEPGDLLLTEGGDWDKLGRGTVWEGEIPTCIHQNHIFRVRVNRDMFDPYYVFSLTRSPYGREYFQGASKQTTNLASINQRQLKEFPVFQLPPPQQKQIIEELSGLDAKIGTLKKSLNQTASELNAMLPSILDRAFKGAL